MIQVREIERRLVFELESTTETPHASGGDPGHIKEERILAVIRPFGRAEAPNATPSDEIAFGRAQAQ